MSFLSADLHSRPRGFPGLHQQPPEGEAAEKGGAAGATRRQPEGHRPSPDQLQAEHHSSGQVLPGERPDRHGEAAVYFISGFKLIKRERMIK